MKAEKKGCDILLVFQDAGVALAKICEFDNDNDAIHLAYAAKIVRNQMFEEAKSFFGFSALSRRVCAISFAYPSDHDT